jgi:hypothetical protein
MEMHGDAWRYMEMHVGHDWRNRWRCWTLPWIMESTDVGGNNTLWSMWHIPNQPETRGVVLLSCRSTVLSLGFQARRGGDTLLCPLEVCVFLCVSLVPRPFQAVVCPYIVLCASSYHSRLSSQRASRMHWVDHSTISPYLSVYISDQPLGVLTYSTRLHHLVSSVHGSFATCIPSLCKPSVCFI